MTAPNGYLPPDLNDLLAAALARPTEGSKLDFKRQLNLTGNDLGEFLKDVLAIVNTDDPEHFRDYGFLLLGVNDDGTLHGLDPQLDVAGLGNRIDQLLREYVSPVPTVHVATGLQHGQGQYAALVIPASQQQPHMIVRNTGTARRGDWWVRSGKHAVLAGPEDYQRVLRKVVDRAVAPLGDRIGQVSGALEALERRFDNQFLVTMTGKRPDAADVPGVTTAMLMREGRIPEEVVLARHLEGTVREFQQQFAELYRGYTEQQLYAARHDLAAWRERIGALEALSRPLGEALGTAVMYQDGTLDEDVFSALLTVCDTVSASAYGSTWDSLGRERAYPLVVLLFTVFVAAVKAGQGTLLRRIGTAVRPQPHTLFPLLAATRRLVLDDDRFATFGLVPRSCATASQRVLNVVAGPEGWLAGDLLGWEREPLAQQADLMQSLVIVDADATRTDGFRAMGPLASVSMYDARVVQAAQALLEKPGLTATALARPVKDVLTDYVQALGGYAVHSTMCFPRLTMQDVDRMTVTLPPRP